MLRTTLSALRDDRGATAMEYGLIAALIAMVVIGAWSLVGTSLQGRFNNVAQAVDR